MKYFILFIFTFFFVIHSVSAHDFNVISKQDFIPLSNYVLNKPFNTLKNTNSDNGTVDIQSGFITEEDSTRSDKVTRKHFIGTNLRHLSSSSPDGFNFNIIGKHDFSLPTEGLYAGFIFGTYISYIDRPMRSDMGGDPDFYSTAFVFGPALNYYLIDGSNFSPFIGIEVPLSLAFNSDSDELFTNAGANLRFGSHYFLSNKFGLSSDIEIGLRGGWGFNIGVVYTR